MQISGKLKRDNTYDAIVIGSGISGGWAAMELCKQGLKTLVLERGRDVEHVKDYPTAMLDPWDFKFGNNNTVQDEIDDPVQSKVYNPGNKHFFIRDKEQPYLQEKPFDWIRGDQVGGRSLIWGRQCYRWSDLDFSANLHDGHGVDWPIRYSDIKSWYDYTESFVGISGKAEGLPHLPDGNFLPPMELNCIERHLAESIKKNDDHRIMTIARVANLTQAWKGRGTCMNRNLCTRGCPFGAYFSSNSSTIPVANSTGNLTLRPFSIVSELIYDERTQKATGVKVIDKLSGELHEFYARIIFVNASTISTTALLLNSVSSRFPNGFGNDSGQLGHNLMDHHSSAGATGIHPGFKDKYYKGRRPAGFLIPRYKNLMPGKSDEDYVRGYNIQGHGERQEWIDKSKEIEGFGKDFKAQLSTPGPWSVWMAGWGECLPYFENKVSLSDTQKDKWGIPLTSIDFSFKANETKMMNDIQQSSYDMLEQAGFENVSGFNYGHNGGSTVHEMGTARMGHDPKTSVLNKFNQMHAVKNVFVTDGSCMVSSACQNPSLTYMALTARACAYAVGKLKRNEL
ncbi:GMC oxidoreductase [Pedobacter foliorum]|uniref:GMC oxidoreductase n=1 Tax=Pedobacter foliorum TaxID=2739058 RepID=UPI0015673818|nr:GMC family oxidoreductase [Pedobacter foliorum]NRF38215.1 GMC family oxidoreductase [Pedobacter foliorum]